MFKPFGLRKIPIEVTQKEKKESKPYQHTHTQNSTSVEDSKREKQGQRNYKTKNC